MIFLSCLQSIYEVSYKWSIFLYGNIPIILHVKYLHLIQCWKSTKQLRIMYSEWKCASIFQNSNCAPLTFFFFFSFSLSLITNVWLMSKMHLFPFSISRRISNYWSDTHSSLWSQSDSSLLHCPMELSRGKLRFLYKQGNCIHI